MTKRKLEKIRKHYEELDYSRWHILGYDELLKINGGSSASSDDDDSDEEADGFSAEDDPGKTSDAEAAAETASESGGHEIENTVEAVANAEVGDTLTRDDGTQVTITQEDIDFVTFPEGLINFCYGIAEVGTGFQGKSLPPSTDLFLEQITFGLAETGFDSGH